MSLWEPPQTVEDYLNRHVELINVYRKTGHDFHFEKVSKKLGEKLYKLEERHHESIKVYSRLCEEILNEVQNNHGIPLKEIWDTLGLDYYTSEAFTDKLENYKERSPAGILFIKTFFEILDEVKDRFNSEGNPLSERRKEEVLEKVATVKEHFLNGYHIEHEVWELKDALCSFFEPEMLEEDFGNKKYEFHSVIGPILSFYDWNDKRLKENGKAKWDLDCIRNELSKGAKLYIESPWMHHPILTLDLLTGILFAFLLPLEKERENYFLSEKAWGISGLTIFVIIFIFPSLSFLILLYAGFLLLRLSQKWKVEKKLFQFRNLYDEVKNEGYDGEEIAKRFDKLESKGIVLPSIIYPLLRLKHKPSKI